MLRVLLYPQEQRAFIPISANQMEMEERVEFLEEYAHFDDCKRHLAEGVRSCDLSGKTQRGAVELQE